MKVEQYSIGYKGRSHRITQLCVIEEIDQIRETALEGWGGGGGTSTKLCLGGGQQSDFETPEAGLSLACQRYINTYLNIF